jgi:hypothetical protein
VPPAPGLSSLLPPSGSPPAAAGTPGTIEDFGASTLLFTDTFDDPASGWGTGSTPGGQVDYFESTLQFATVADGTWVWSYRPLESTQNVVRMETVFTASAAGYQGLLCANSEDTLYGAVANADGRWVFIRLTDAGAEIITTDDDPAWAILPGAATRLRLDCAGTTTGSFRMQLALPDSGLVARYEGGADGPASFDRVALYGEASAAGFTLRADDASAFGGTG